MNCYICDSQKEVKPYEFYVIGSEGCNLCLDCRIVITEIIRHMARIGHRLKLEYFKKER